MVKQNISNTNLLSIINPLIIIIILIILLIIVLAIFKETSPFLNLSIDVNANIGDLKGSFDIEVFEDCNNEEEDEILQIPSKVKSYYVKFPINFDKNLPIYKLFFPNNNSTTGIKFSIVRPKNSYPYLVNNDSNSEYKNTPLKYTPRSSFVSYIFLPKEFEEDKETINTFFLIQADKINNQGNFNMIRVCDVTLYAISSDVS